jgi:hypothetical protein
VLRLKKIFQEPFAAIDVKSMVKPFLFLISIYFIGYFSLFRANFTYTDGVYQTITGQIYYTPLSRFFGDFFIKSLNTNFLVTDISPLYQILGIIFISISSIILIYTFCNKKITIIPLIASLSIGFNPFIFETMMLKFDAATSTVSLLFNIIPFVFLNSNAAFVISSIVCVFLSFSTYQGVVGVYPMVVMTLIFWTWINKPKSYKIAFVFVVRAAICYLIAAAIFYVLFLQQRSGQEYANTTVLRLSDMPRGILNNFNLFLFAAIFHSLNKISQIFLILCIFLFLIITTRISKQNKILSFVISFFFIFITIALVCGAQIVFVQMNLPLRALCSFGVFFSCLTIPVLNGASYASTRHISRLFFLFALTLNWCFLVFTLSIGNAAADHMRYTEFRTIVLLQDISELFPERENKDLSIRLKNSIGWGPILTHVAKKYPSVYKYAWDYLTEHVFWHDYYLLNFFHDQQIQSGTVKQVGLTFDPLPDYGYSHLPVIKDTYYHTIKSDGERILVELKH